MGYSERHFEALVWAWVWFSGCLVHGIGACVQRKVRHLDSTFEMYAMVHVAIPSTFTFPPCDLLAWIVNAWYMQYSKFTSLPSSTLCCWEAFLRCSGRRTGASSFQQGEQALSVTQHHQPPSPPPALQRSIRPESAQPPPIPHALSPFGATRLFAAVSAFTTFPCICPTRNCGSRMPTMLSSRHAVSLGCAPTPTQYRARDTSSLMSFQGRPCVSPGRGGCGVGS
jgi:hypothetical protein